MNIVIKHEYCLLKKLTLIGLFQGAGGYGSEGSGTANHPKSHIGLCKHLLYCPLLSFVVTVSYHDKVIICVITFT